MDNLKINLKPKEVACCPYKHPLIWRGSPAKYKVLFTFCYSSKCSDLGLKIGALSAFKAFLKGNRVKKKALLAGVIPVTSNCTMNVLILHKFNLCICGLQMVWTTHLKQDLTGQTSPAFVLGEGESLRLEPLIFCQKDAFFLLFFLM